MISYILWGAILGAILGAALYFYIYSIWLDFETLMYVVGGIIIGAVFGVIIFFIQWWVLVPILMIFFFFSGLWQISIIILIISLFLTSLWWISLILIGFLVIINLFVPGGNVTLVRPYTRVRYGKVEHVKGHERRFWHN